MGKYKVICPHCGEHIYNVDANLKMGETVLRADLFKPAKESYPEPRNGSCSDCPECGKNVDITEVGIYYEQKS